MRFRNLPAPYLMTVLAGLLVIGVAGWGWQGGGVGGLRVAQLSRTKAKMSDGTCVFTADFELQSVANRLTFARHQQALREAIVTHMRTKSRYMVETPLARQALAVQLRNLANRTMDGKLTNGVRFSEFVLY